jgi:hypothetical protein
MPGLLVAGPSIGAHVMTVMGSPPEPPVAPGMIPQPATSDAPATVAAAAVAALVRGRVVRGRTVLLVRRLPVMRTHDSVTSPTWE